MIWKFKLCNFNSALDVGAPIILGGLPASLGYDINQTFAAFTGCLRNVRVDDNFVDFHNPIEQNGMDVRTCALLDVPCQSSLCSNGATCIGLGDSFQCRCPVRFSGELCEEGLCNVTVMVVCCFTSSVCVCVCVCVRACVRVCVCAHCLSVCICVLCMLIYNCVLY